MKRSYWRKYCDSIGSTTQVGEIWGMIRKMGWESIEDEQNVPFSMGELNRALAKTRMTKYATSW